MNVDCGCAKVCASAVALGAGAVGAAIVLGVGPLVAVDPAGGGWERDRSAVSNTRTTVSFSMRCGNFCKLGKGAATCGFSRPML